MLFTQMQMLVTTLIIMRPPSAPPRTPSPRHTPVLAHDQVAQLCRAQLLPKALEAGGLPQGGRRCNPLPLGADARGDAQVRGRELAHDDEQNLVGQQALDEPRMLL